MSEDELLNVAKSYKETFITAYAQALEDFDSEICDRDALAVVAWDKLEVKAEVLSHIPNAFDSLVAFSVIDDRGVICYSSSVSIDGDFAVNGLPPIFKSTGELEVKVGDTVSGKGVCFVVENPFC